MKKIKSSITLVFTLIFAYGLLLPVLCFFTSTCASAQGLQSSSTPKSLCLSGPEFLFTAGTLNNGGNYGYSIAQDGNCVIVVAGTSNNYGSGGYDILLIGLDTTGTYLWSKTIGGGSDDMNGQIDITPENNYVIAGSTKSWGITTNADILLMKMNPPNTVVWSTVVGSTTIDESLISLVRATDNGYFVLAENFSVYEGLLYKFNSSGVVQWSKRIGRNTTTTTTSDYYQDMKATADGGCVIAGWSWSYRRPGAGSRQMIVQKYDATGTLEWAKIIGHGPSGLGGLDGSCITQTAHGDYIVGGKEVGSVIVKLNSAGSLIWAKETGADAIYPYKIISTTDGGYFMSGVASYWHPNNKISRTYCKMDSLCNFQWLRTDNILDGHPNPWDGPCSAIEVADGFLGLANSHIHTGAYAQTNIAVEKFKTNGNACYSATATTTFSDTAVVVSDITDSVMKYLVNLPVALYNPVITPVAQNVQHWTDCSNAVTGINENIPAGNNINIIKYADMLQIISDIELSRATITDMTGRQVLNIYAAAGQTTMQINIAILPSSIYLITVSDKNGKICSKKFVM